MNAILRMMKSRAWERRREVTGERKNAVEAASVYRGQAD
jgi:hypothetical protein